LADIERALSTAQSDLNQLAYEQAGNALSGILQDLISIPPSEDRCRLFREASMMRAWTLIKLHKEPQAKIVLEKMERVAEVKPDRTRFPPSFAKFVASVRAQSTKAATESLSIITRPEGVEVFVDGCSVGKSPIKVPVSQGEYRVDAAFASGLSLPKTVKVEGPASVELDSDFQAEVFTEKGPCVAFSKERKTRLASMAKLASHLGVRSLITLREEERADGEKYMVASFLDSSTGVDGREARLKISTSGVSQGEMEKLAEWIATGAALAPVEAIATNDIQLPSIKDSPLSTVAVGATAAPKWRKTAAWTLGGAAVAMGVIAIIEQVRLNSTMKDIDKLQSPDGPYMSSDDASRYAELTNRARRESNWRTGMAMGAGAAAVGSGAFYWFSIQPFRLATTAANHSGTPGFSLVVGGNY
jgi:hypothetical protein